MICRSLISLYIKKKGTKEITHQTMSKLRSSKRKSNTLQSDVNPEKQNSSGTKKQKKEEISRNKNGRFTHLKKKSNHEIS